MRIEKRRQLEAAQPFHSSATYHMCRKYWDALHPLKRLWLLNSNRVIVDEQSVQITPHA